jgi:hypothetical protein
VRTLVTALPVHFADADHWQAFSMSTGQRAMWRAVPEAERPAVRADAERRLTAAAHPSGGFLMHQQIRYTLGIRPDTASRAARWAEPIEQPGTAAAGSAGWRAAT